MKNKLLPITLSLLLCCSLAACAKEPTLSVGATENETAEASSPPSTILQEGADMGQSYLDSFIFLGESTTYHLKSRGVLSGGTNTRQVWGPDSGTVNLDHTVITLRIRYPDTGEYLTVGEAAARKKPKFMILTFGLNGAVQNVRRGKEYYKSCYRALIDAICEASPETKVILQSCFPVAANMDMSHYSCTLDELNGYIDTINGWILELAEEHDLRYLNTAEILKDENGRLKPSYQSGDGHHLTRDAYLVILQYIRTHGYR